jgi:hypothetical protein
LSKMMGQTMICHARFVMYRSNVRLSGMIMKVFIASHSQENARALKHKLENAGYEVVSRWVTNDHKFSSGIGAYSDAEREDLAVVDETDVRAADALVLIAEAEGVTVPGGKHVETGIAIGLRKPVIVVGRKENIFHWHPSISVVRTQDELMAALNRLNNCGLSQGLTGS